MLASGRDGRGLAFAAAALVGAVALLCVSWGGPWASAQTVPLLRETQTGIAVTTPAFTALISPANGGRVTSFRFGGAEMTRISPDGHGGLFEERHTADFRFSVVELIRTEREASVTLSADAGDLRIVKRYMFRADRPWFTLRATFENRSPYPRSGSDGPAFMSVVLPAGVEADAGHLYCLNRGAGAEVLTERVFLTSPGGRGSRALRWIAVADPASRRSVGFTLQGCGVSALPAMRTSDGALAFGWSYPRLPAGRKLTTELRVIPWEGFSALAELNDRFAVETLPGVDRVPLPVRFDIAPLAEPLRAVSVITRAYAADGRELAPCDPVLFRNLEPGRPSRAEIGRAEDAEQPAILLHEVYSEGRRIGAFHVPLRPGVRPAEPVPVEAPPDPEPIDGLTLPEPGAGIAVTADAEARGFLLWAFEGPEPAAEPDALDLCLGEGERYAAFVGVRGLRDISRLRFTVAGAADAAGPAAAPIPAGASALWQIEEGPEGAFMTPVSDIQLSAGEVVWLALTLDAGAMRPRSYSARLVADSDGTLWQLPVSVQVVGAAPLSAGSFGLWYSPDGDAPPDEPSLAKLGDYGVACLTVSESSARDQLVGAVEERGFDILALCRGLGGLPPARVAGGLVLLAEPRQVWLARAGVAPPRTQTAAAGRGYATALSCDRIEAVPEEMLSREHRYVAVMADDGCPLGAVPELYADDRLSGDEQIWLHLDVRGMHWRRAVTAVRSAIWAAGWQGMAGVVVSASPPAREVDRQAVMWNIIRDARGEVARWRQVRGAMRAAPDGGRSDPRQVRARAIVESLVGTGEGCDLRLAPVRRPFRELLRVAPPASAGELSLRAFRAAHRAVLLSGTTLPPRARQDKGVSYWDGIPCTEDGAVLWAIALGEGEAARERALALQGAIERATGTRIPAGRALPRAGRRGPRLVWLVGGASPPEGWPPDVREAAARVPHDGLAMVEADGGMKIVVVGGGVALERLTATFRRQAPLYAPARRVQ